jgi:serine/threonine protein kinase
LSKKHGTLRAEGTFKRVTDAVEVAPYKERAVARRIIRMVTKADHDISDREIDFEERYGNILSWTRYQSKNRPYETKTMILQEAFDNDLYLYTKYTSGNQRKKLEFNELLEVLLQAASTLHEMHEDGLAHRDVKIKNVLYRKTSDGKVEAKLIDFGHSYRIDEGKYPKKRAKGYGTLRYTSPDALEFPKNTSNPRLLAQAEDMYALGCLIYEVYFQKVLPWGSDTYKACKDKENGQQHRQKAIKLQKKEAKRLLEKSQEKPGKPESELMWICARLLEPDPKLRMRMPEFLVALKELKNP